MNIIERTRQLRCFEFDELDILGVLDNVDPSGLEAGIGAQFDQPCRLQEQ